MLAEFQKAQAEFLAEQKAEQQEADGICGGMHLKLCNILKTSPDVQKGGSLGTVLHMMVRGNFDEVEQLGNWRLTLPVDLDDPEPRKVTIIAFGGKHDPSESTYSMISIVGASEAIELWPDRGEIVDRTEYANGNAAVTDKDDDQEAIANMRQARFYEKVLNRFEEAKNVAATQTHE